MKIDLQRASRVPFYQRISYWYLPALFVLTSVILEIMMFALMHIAFPKAYIFSLTILLIIAAVVALLRRKWLQTVICSLLLGWQLTTTISNIIANDTCMEIFSLETLKSLLILGFLKSRSTTSTLIPLNESETARLHARVVLPSPATQDSI